MGLGARESRSPETIYAADLHVKMLFSRGATGSMRTFDSKSGENIGEWVRLKTRRPPPRYSRAMHNEGANHSRKRENPRTASAPGFQNPETRKSLVLARFLKQNCSILRVSFSFKSSALDS